MITGFPTATLQGRVGFDDCPLRTGDQLSRNDHDVAMPENLCCLSSSPRLVTNFKATKIGSCFLKFVVKPRDPRRQTVLIAPAVDGWQWWGCAHWPTSFAFLENTQSYYPKNAPAGGSPDSRTKRCQPVPVLTTYERPNSRVSTSEWRETSIRCPEIIFRTFAPLQKKQTEHASPTENQTTARPQRSAGQASTSRQSNSQHPIPLSLPAPEMALRPPPTASDHRATISAA